MKKFVILMISFLVLFVFLMLNYLLWDKENLQKQSATDKIEQDWLRGQNRTLQITVEEQETSIGQLKKENQNYQSRIIELEQQLRQTKDLLESSAKQVGTLNQAVTDYQHFTRDTLKAFTNDWFLSINEARYADAIAFFSSDGQVFGKPLNLEHSGEDISYIKSITFLEQDEASGKRNNSFAVIKGMGNVYEVMAEATIELKVAADETVQPLEGLVEGTNLLQLTYRYFPNQNKWVIVSVMAINSAKP